MPAAVDAILSDVALAAHVLQVDSQVIVAMERFHAGLRNERGSKGDAQRTLPSYFRSGVDDRTAGVGAGTIRSNRLLSAISKSLRGDS